jgi:3-oxocholest-4-en-26-oyl-CoA dehydrogenase alpha subunit
VQAPVMYHFLADRQVGPGLIHFGSEWQKEYFLPKIVSAETSFCLLFSEPNAGSDLAAVSTTAVKDGDDYVINGQKVWTSWGHKAEYGWMLARTNLDNAVPRHLSCSEIIITMDSPGITVRPIINMVGKHSFNEVFFDNVRISSKFLVGKENAGFKQIMAQMDYERAGLERVMQNYPIFMKLKAYVKELGKEGLGAERYSWARDALAQLEVEFNIGRLLCYYTAWTIDQDRQPTAEAPMAKAFCTQFEQRLNDLATNILGSSSQIRSGGRWGVWEGELAESYLWAPSYTLQGGSVEVLKNILALRKLGLPRN